MIGLILWSLLGIGQASSSASREMLPELGMVSEHPINIDNYVLNAGDTLLVLVKGSFSYSYPTQITPTSQLILMLPSGRSVTTFGQKWGDVSLVNLEAVGYVNIVDVPVRKARKIVADAFSKFIRPVQVDFILLGPRTCKINVFGDVQWPGSHLVTPFMRVKDAIDKAGGITSMGSASKIDLIRRSGDTIKVNLRHFKELGDIDANPLLNDGDIIFIPKMNNYVLLKGAVFAREAIDESALLPDTMASEIFAEHWLEFDKGEKVCDFLSSRAVFSPQSDMANCYIQRGDERLFFNMQEFLASKTGNNPRLKHGDIITVPRLEKYVYVTGEVGRTGWYLYDENKTINTYINQARGFRYTANVRGIRVIYPDGRTKRAYPDMPLEPGVTIHVPRRALYNTSEWIRLAAAGISLVGAIIAFGK